MLPFNNYGPFLQKLCSYIQLATLTLYTCMIVIKKTHFSFNMIWFRITGENHLICDCKLLWLKSLPRNIPSSITCTAPTHLNSQVITSVPDDQFVCGKLHTTDTINFF